MSVAWADLNSCDRHGARRLARLGEYKLRVDGPRPIGRWVEGQSPRLRLLRRAGTQCPNLPQRRPQHGKAVDCQFQIVAVAHRNLDQAPIRQASRHAPEILTKIFDNTGGAVSANDFFDLGESSGPSKTGEAA